MGPRLAGIVGRVQITPRVRRWSAVAIVVLIAVFGWLAVRDSWRDVRTSIDRLHWYDLVVAVGFAAAASGAAFVAWRSVFRAVAGSVLPRHDAAVMYFCSQAGKYVPGSVWPAVIQTEMGARNRVPRSAIVITYFVTLLVTLASAALLSGLVLVDAGRDAVAWAGAAAMAGGVVAVGVLLHRHGVQRLVHWVLARRRITADGLGFGRRAAAAGLAWSFLFWVLSCVPAVVVAERLAPGALGATGIAVVCGAFVLSWLCGFLALPVPAGAGVREAVLTFSLAAPLGRPVAIGLALVTRLATVVAELGLAVLFGLPGVISRTRHERLRGETPESAPGRS